MSERIHMKSDIDEIYYAISTNFCFGKIASLLELTERECFEQKLQRKWNIFYAQHTRTYLQALRFTV
jgi:hypothetical protein